MISRSSWGIAALLLLVAVVHVVAADTPDCRAEEVIAREEPTSPCAVLLARAVWLDALAMDESFQLIRDSPSRSDRWLGSDKVMHFGVSFMLTITAQYTLEHRLDLSTERAWPVAAGTALAFGLFKELADSQREQQPLFSWRDMAANTAGIAAALVLIKL